MRGACLWLIAFGLIAGSARAQEQLKLIPQPKQVTMREGRFAITPETAVLVADDPDDSFAAGQLIEEIATDLGILLKLREPAADQNSVWLKRVAAGEHGEEAYEITVKPGSAIVAASSAKGIFYGVQTLRQLIRANCNDGSIPACTIVDWPALKYRGWQDDISRGPIPTMDFLKREIRLMSSMKLNLFTMYTEHVFRLEKHLAIAPMQGLTADEVRELVEYAKKFHVEIVGNFQSFGHFASILQVKGYEHLGEAGWIISPGKEESYQFLSDVYGEIAPAYESALFNINCDEVSGLGTGASKAMVEKIGVPGVYAYHINRIAEMLKKHGKTPMMWGDIAVQHPEIRAKLPKDLIVLSWGYNAQPSYVAAIEPFTKMGFRFMVCPGVWSWNAIWPNISEGFQNIAIYSRDGARGGAMGVLNTSWDDSGENLFNCNWYLLLWGAECAWNPTSWPARERFDELFGPVFHGSGPDPLAAEAFWKMHALRSNPLVNGFADSVYWEDPLGKNLDPKAAQELASKADEIMGLLLRAKVSSKREADTLDAAIFAARRLRFMGRRVLQVNDSAPLVDEAVAIRAEYARLWRSENREWWLDRNLAKYDAQIARMKRWPDVPALKLGATFTSTLETYQDNAPIRAFDGSQDSFFWSNRGVKAGDTFTMTLKEPLECSSVNVTTGHRDHVGDFLQDGVLELSRDGHAFETAAKFKEGSATAKFDGRPVKAVRIKVTADQQYWLVIREIEFK